MRDGPSERQRVNVAVARYKRSEPNCGYMELICRLAAPVSDRTRRMTSRFTTPMKKAIVRSARLVIAGLAALFAADGHAEARSARGERAVQSVETRVAGEPIMAIISLRAQRITVYDPKGWILRAPVSSGQRGRETPAGVFSVIQKDAEHYSNLYDDAYMPNMQRLTWSGIAIHGGPMPGYPASHGCVRMPYDFAAHLFDRTHLGMRVIVAPGDAAPVEIAHPLLLRSNPGAAAAAAARAAEAEAAARKADEARLAAVTAAREAARAMVPLRRMENLQRRAEAQRAAAEKAVETATSDEARSAAGDAKAKAEAALADLQAQLISAKAELQPKLDAVAPAREAATAAENARAAAADAASATARALEPVSVFISRKTQHLYVRRAFQPIFDAPITIRDPDRPIGTHVLTAMDRAGDGPDLRWIVVTVESGDPHESAAEPPVRRHARSADEAEPVRVTNPAAAKAALDRIVIPQDVMDRIAAMGSPRSSLIVSDEDLSSETGKGTDFIVILNDQPQGGIAMRRRNPEAQARYDLPRRRLSPPFPFGGSNYGGTYYGGPYYGGTVDRGPFFRW
jgi:hypothetical protein